MRAPPISHRGLQWIEDGFIGLECGNQHRVNDLNVAGSIVAALSVSNAAELSGVKSVDFPPPRSNRGSKMIGWFRGRAPSTLDLELDAMEEEEEEEAEY